MEYLVRNNEQNKAYACLIKDLIICTTNIIICKVDCKGVSCADDPCNYEIM